MCSFCEILAFLFFLLRVIWPRVQNRDMGHFLFLIALKIVPPFAFLIVFWLIVFNNTATLVLAADDVSLVVFDYLISFELICFFLGCGPVFQFLSRLFNWLLSDFYTLLLSDNLEFLDFSFNLNLCCSRFQNRDMRQFIVFNCSQTKFIAIVLIVLQVLILLLQFFARPILSLILQLLFLKNGINW